MASPTRSRRPANTSRSADKNTGKSRRHDNSAATNRRQEAGRTDDRSAVPAALTTSQRRYLRSLCHNLKPLILLGNKGVTDNLKTELARTLDHHELVKIRLSGGDREERQKQLDTLLEASGAELVQQIGHVASLHRRNRDNPQLALPN